MIDSIADDLLKDPDFSARLTTDDPKRTICMHIREWVAYMEGRKPKPPQKY